MENKDVLKDIKAIIEKVTATTKYEFGDKSNDKIIEYYERMLMSISKDNTITAFINHTKFPDDVIVAIANLKGMDISSIFDIDQVTCDISYENNIISCKFDIKLHTRLDAITCKISCDDLNDNQKGDDNKCE